MKSLIKVYNFLETLEDDGDDTSFKAIMDMKKDLKEQLFELLLSNHNDENKKKEELEYRKHQESEKYKRLQKEREEEGEVCPRCSRRDCCC